MKQRIKRILACMLAIVAAFTAVFSNVTPAMAVSAEAALSYWDASAKDVGEVSEIKPDFYHGKILYGLIDGHSAYCMNFGLQAYAPPPEGFKDYNEWLVKAKKQQQSYSQCICR